MALNFSKFWEGIKILARSSSAANSKGDLEVIDSTGKLQYHNGTTVSPVVTAAHTETLTNKSIDADSNTITNIEDADIKAGAAIDRTKLASGTADHVIINNGSGILSSEATLAKSRGGSGQDNSSITFPASGTLVTEAGTQTLTGKTIDGDDNTVQDLPLTALKTQLSDANEFIVRDASGIVVSANTVPTGTVVGTSDTQTLTNKTFSDAVLFTDEIQLQDPGAGTNKITIQAPTLAGDYTLTLPVDDGASGEVLSTNGSGVLSWTSSSANVDVEENGTPVGSFNTLNFLNANVTDAGGGVVDVEIEGGGLASNGVTSTKSSNYTILTADDGAVIPVNTSGGAVTITLPAPSAGFKVTIKDIGGSANVNFITVARNGSENIDGGGGNDIIDLAYAAHSYVSDGTDWFRVALFTGDVISSGIGVFGGGSTGSASNVMDYIQLTTSGTATDFGDLTEAKRLTGACSSSTRGIFGGAISGPSNVMDYITIATTGNSADFGDLTIARYAPAGLSNSTRGIFGGGYGTNYTDRIDYITIASTGNATTFGDLLTQLDSAGALANTTRGVFVGGYRVAINIIQYITIASTGNATDFGDLTADRYGIAGASNSTRGVFAGGQAYAGINPVNIIEYITIATTGNSVDFGDLSANRRYAGGCANSTHAYFAGGDENGGTRVNTIEYVTIASTGNATDFGDLTVARNELSGLSNAHGGL